MESRDHLKRTDQDPFSADNLAIDRPDPAPTLAEIWHRRITRRQWLKGTAGAATAVSGIALLAGCDWLDRSPGFDFEGVPHGVDDTHHVAAGHRADILIRWGDPIISGGPAFDPHKQSAENQLLQFGYNNDYVGLVPLPFGDTESNRSLLCVNHEFTNDDLMHPGLGDAPDPRTAMTADMVDISMAAHGGSIVEIKRTSDGAWQTVPDSPFNRRISTLQTNMRLSGPAAGHERLRTNADPSGERVIGTLNNCAGGITPWGTYLMAEENINFYFDGTLPLVDGQPHRETANYARLGIPTPGYPWARFHDRFDIGKEPNEPNRFGWIVEVDPYDPTSTPVKRTALGRFKHEGAESTLTGDGRLVLYSGDDQQNEYLYRFVSNRPVDLTDRRANADLLDDGVLSVAIFDDTGTGHWAPLIFGTGPLVPANGFRSQADVLIETRRAADLLKATPLDRPEDVEPDKRRAAVYVSLTNNKSRGAEETNGPNPRPKNLWGQIVELLPDAQDHASDSFTWVLLVLCGDPADPQIGARWTPQAGPDQWFACPDNLASDSYGRLWVATDQGSHWAATSGTADGLWALETGSPNRGLARCLFRVPMGAEMCGPCPTPDATAIFVAVQHPGADGSVDTDGKERRSTFDDPATRWPDFRPDTPPRPAILTIRKINGGIVGA